MNVQRGTFCSNCGAPLTAGDRFCRDCGTAFTSVASSETNATTAQPTILPRAAAPSKRWMVWAAVGAGAMVLIAIGAFALGRRDTPSPPVARDSPTAVATEQLEETEAFEDLAPPEEPPSLSPLPPVATREINSSIGKLLIQKAQLTNQYSVCSNAPGQCSQAPENEYVLILTVKSAEGRSGEDFSQELSPASIESYIMSAQGKRADPDHTTTGSGGTAEIWYAHFDSKSQGQLILHWPDNPPIILPL